jgi:peptidoglycan/xylan/chitin deacetylase (PgdA/CDA1 family)
MLDKLNKDKIFRVLGTSFRLWPISHFSKQFFKKRRTIIFYHAVWPEGDARQKLFGGMALSAFKNEMARLSRYFKFVSLGQLMAESYENPDGRPSIAVTFDDGFDLIGGGALDVMEGFGIPATVFVNTEAYSYNRLLWQHAFTAILAEKGENIFVKNFNKGQQENDFDLQIGDFSDQIAVTRHWPQSRNDELTDLIWQMSGMETMTYFLETYHPYLDLEDLQSWLHRGHDVGFHTRAHPFSSRLLNEDLNNQIRDPAIKLKKQLNLSTLPFAYPFGDRATPEHERQIIEWDLFSYLFGTAGLSSREELPDVVERVETEAGVDELLFGKTIIRSIRNGNGR